MSCRIDHLAPDALPEFLCRACHPELSLSKQDRASLDRQEAEKRESEHRLAENQRELRAARERLSRLDTKRRMSAVDKKAAAGLRAIVARLEQEVENTSA